MTREMQLLLVAWIASQGMGIVQGGLGGLRSSLRRVMRLNVGLYNTNYVNPLNEEISSERCFDHEAIKYRVRSGEVTKIPQAERYSTKDWLHNLLTLPTSRLLRRIRGIVFLNFLWSVVVVLAHALLKFEMCSSSPLCLTLLTSSRPGSKCHALLGSVLGLLLVFRTNTAYNRFWEGRRIWERVLSVSRDLARFALVFSESISQARVERMLHLVCLFPMVLQEHVQGYADQQALREHLLAEEVAGIGRVTNKPYFVTCKLAQEIVAVSESQKFTARERQTMLKYADDLSGCIGACERLVQTPVPLSYARHTSRFLSLFCLTAPLALVQELGISVIPFVTLMSWSLFGIQEIGMMIEDPFQGALRLEVFANTIRRDVGDLVHITKVHPEPLAIEDPSFDYEVPLHCRLQSVQGRSGS